MKTSNARLILLIIALGFLAHSFMLGAPFRGMDDEISILNNSLVKDPSRVIDIFRSSFFGENHYYRPLVSLSFMVEYQLFGPQPFFYNLNNLLLHLACAVIVFFLIKEIIGNRMVAFFSALLFAIHPVQWEAVANIAGRAVILNAFFVLLAFLCYLLSGGPGHSVLKQRILPPSGQDSKLRAEYPGPPYYLLSLIFFFFALLSKESAAMLPVVLLIFTKPRRAIIPYFVIIAGYLVLRYSLGIIEVFRWDSVNETLLGFMTFLRGSLTYVRLFVLPVDLHFDRARVLFTGWLNPELLLTVLIFVGLGVVAVRQWGRTRPVILFLIAWFLIELFPVSQIVATIGTQPGVISIAEHFLYLPSVAALTLLVLAFQWFYAFNEKARWCSARVLKFLAGGMIVFFMLTTVQQNVYARSTIAMLKRSLHFFPHNVRVLYSLGLEVAKYGYYQEAEGYFRRALHGDPSSVIARIGLGKALCDQGRYREGVEEYRKVKTPGRYRELLKENLRLTRELL